MNLHKLSKAPLLIILTIVFFLCTDCNNYSVTKPKYMWFDCEANFVRLSYPDSISYYFKKLKDIGITDVVADVKGITGETLFKSKYAPYMEEWNGFRREEGYDMLKTFITEAHKSGLKAHASLNVFSGGHIYLKRGIIYNEHPEWQSMVYNPTGITPVTEAKMDYNGMLNPALPEVRSYELNILKEVVTDYPDLDGIIMDRVRYSGITTDFSEASKEIFEEYAGIKTDSFPSEIMYWQKNSKGDNELVHGALFNKWIEWRVSVIYTFIKDVRDELKAINPDIMISDYAGSWYPEYYKVGVNWASNKYDPSKEYNWATKEYMNYGYAELLDEFQTGLYYPKVTIKAVTGNTDKDQQTVTEVTTEKNNEYWYSVEGAAKLSKEVVMDAVPVIGSIYVEMYKDNPGQFSKAVSMALKSTDGLMIFDIVHIINHNWWNVLGKGIAGSDNIKR